MRAAVKCVGTQQTVRRGSPEPVSVSTRARASAGRYASSSSG